ncbi:MAG: DUF6152 family protein [Candidatus Rariloculaceae bacterium]
MLNSKLYHRPFALLLTFLPVVATAHHSLLGYDPADIVELRGEITEVFWRNPHVRVSLKTVDENGAEQIWDIESSPVTTMERRGISSDFFRVGDTIEVAANPSNIFEDSVRPILITLPDGETVVFNPEAAAANGLLDANAVSVNATPVSSSASDLDAEGIFRVWTNRDRHWMQDVRTWWARVHPLTASAQQKLDAWDPKTDDLTLQCIPAGMPEAMLMPFPIEFIDAGDEITLNIEEWDNSRTIQMTDESDADAPSSHLGYSVGRWEGNTLVVETDQVDYAFFNDRGIPQSDALSIVERFTLSENDTKLDWTATVTDQETFTEPVILPDFHWDWIPGQELKPYNCTVDAG